jgi:hypothetical protein
MNIIHTPDIIIRTGRPIDKPNTYENIKWKMFSIVFSSLNKVIDLFVDLQGFEPLRCLDGEVTSTLATRACRSLFS